MPKKIVLLLLSLSLFAIFVQTVNAEDAKPNCAGQTGVNAEVVCLENPLGAVKVDGKEVSRTNIGVIIGEIVSKVLGVLGALTLLVFVVGGVFWLTSAGNAEKVKTGSQTMLWAVIGLFVIFGSYVILNLVLKGLSQQNGMLPAQKLDWCLTSEKKCVQGGGGPCSGGKTYKTEAECKSAMEVQ